jgi:hypothetical protein
MVVVGIVVGGSKVVVVVATTEEKGLEQFRYTWSDKNNGLRKMPMRNIFPFAGSMDSRNPLIIASGALEAIEEDTNFPEESKTQNPDEPVSHIFLSK